MKYIFLLALAARYVLQGTSIHTDRVWTEPHLPLLQCPHRGRAVEGRGAQLAAQIATSSAAVLDIVTCAGNEGSQ